MNRIVTDHRMEHILHKGDTIQSKEHLYTITGEPIGFGGSSILYPALRSGSELLYAIKEYFPSNPIGGFTREGGIIRPVEPSNTVNIAAYRERMETERKLSQRIRAASDRAIGIWDLLTPSAVTADGKTYTEGVKDGIFAVLERMDNKGLTFAQLLEEIAKPKEAAHPCRTGGLPKLYTTACMIEQVLHVLQRIHDAGYLFGDIQDGNIFFSDCRLEDGDIGIGNLLDFGCTRELIDGKRTAPIDESFFTTKGFIPPELLDPAKNDGTLTLGPEADLYAVGCLMLRCLVSKFKIAALGDSPTVGSNAVDGQDAKKLGCPENIRKTLNRILTNAMAMEPKDRYPSAAAMLVDIRALKRDTRPPEYLLPPAPGASESFVSHSRDREIAELTRALEQDEPVFIWGLGGIGKTETAIQVAKNWNTPKGAYFVRFIPSDETDWESMKETVLRMHFTDYQFAPKQPLQTPDQFRETEYRERMDILRKEYGGALLIIDNFDHPGKTLDDLRSEHSYQAITNLGIKILFTTRYPADWAPQWELHELSENKLLQLMRRYCTDPAVSDDDLEQLIAAAEGHTLTVELMAKTLGRSRRKVSPKQMLDSLRSRNLSMMNPPDVRSDQNREIRMAAIHEHLRKLFNLSGLGVDARKLLCCAALLPESGMDCAMFEACLEDGPASTLAYILDYGWLKNSADNQLTIHPVIREVCREELKPDGEKCLAFLENLLKQYDDQNTSAPINLLLAECFEIAANTIADDQAYYSYTSGWIYQTANYPGKALPCYENTLSIRKAVLPEDDPELAEIYRTLGDICLSLHFMYEYHLDLLKEESPDDYFSRAMLSAWQREYISKAITYYKQAVFIQHKDLTAYHTGVYHAADCLHFLYFHKLQDFEKAALYAKMALKCQTMLRTPNYQDLATCYHKLGNTYSKLGRSKEAEKNLKRAFRIRKRTLPPNHPDIDDSYLSLALFYDQVNKRKADKYWHKWAFFLSQEEAPKKSVFHKLFRKGH